MRRQDRFPNTDTFTYHNANPKGRITGDCVVRAICTALNASWEDTLSELTELALKIKEMTNDKKCFSKYLESKGFVKHSQPHKPDGSKYTGSEFCSMLPVGHKPIVAMIGGHHVVCIKDKKVLDIWDSTEKCIGNYWQMP